MAPGAVILVLVNNGLLNNSVVSIWKIYVFELAKLLAVEKTNSKFASLTMQKSYGKIGIISSAKINFVTVTSLFNSEYSAILSS